MEVLRSIVESEEAERKHRYAATAAFVDAGNPGRQREQARKWAADPKLRAFGMFLLADCAEGVDAEDLARYVSVAEPRIRRKILSTLRTLANTAAERHLLVALEDAGSGEAAEIAGALRTCGTVGSIAPLRHALARFESVPAAATDLRNAIRTIQSRLGGGAGQLTLSSEAGQEGELSEVERAGAVAVASVEEG